MEYLIDAGMILERDDVCAIFVEERIEKNMLRKLRNMLRKRKDLPSFMQNDEVKEYYDILDKKRFSLFLKRCFDIVGYSCNTYDCNGSYD